LKNTFGHLLKIKFKVLSKTFEKFLNLEESEFMRNLNKFQRKVEFETTDFKNAVDTIQSNEEKEFANKLSSLKIVKPVKETVKRNLPIKERLKTQTFFYEQLVKENKTDILKKLPIKTRIKPKSPQPLNKTSTVDSFRSKLPEIEEIKHFTNEKILLI
jgi:hypothetical protein